MNQKLVFISGDSHVGMPQELWGEYLERRFHGDLPKVREEAAIAPTALYLVNAANRTMELPEYVEAHLHGWHGLHDPAIRLADMDADGVAAEILFHGDSRLQDLFFNVTNRAYSFESWHAGVRAWNRWAHDTFGGTRDRFLITAPSGPCVDMEATLADLEWIAEHGFIGTYAPGYMQHAGLAPLYDSMWDPFWSTCASLGLVVVVHAGYGSEQGALYDELERIYRAAVTAARTTDLDVVLAHADAVGEDSKDYIRDLANHSAPARRPLWQLTLGGVFDRHPELKVMLSEVRVDWIPATLVHLDGRYDEHRADLPARRKPSEYWDSNCFAVASFVHKAEVELRHQLGIDRLGVGRDYPHSEGTWPHSRLWLNDAFSGVPDNEVRKIFGENAIRFLGLDRSRLVEIAGRIGLDVADINGPAPDLDPAVAKNFQRRGGYFKPAEGASRLASLEQFINKDIAGIRRT